MLFTNLEKTNGGQAVLAPFDWEKHSEWSKDCEVSTFTYEMHRLLIKHYPKYESVITEICIVEKSVTAWIDCEYCHKEKRHNLKYGVWNESELLMVVSDCRKFLKGARILKERGGE